MPTCLYSQQVVNSADDNINSGSVASLCSQVVLELCEENILTNYDAELNQCVYLPEASTDSLLYILLHSLWLCYPPGFSNSSGTLQEVTCQVTNEH